MSANLIKYTVVGLLDAGAGVFQRYGTTVEAVDAEHAESIAAQDAPYTLLVAAVIAGEHECLDAAYAVLA